MLRLNANLLLPGSEYQISSTETWLANQQTDRGTEGYQAVVIFLLERGKNFLLFLFLLGTQLRGVF